MLGSVQSSSSSSRTSGQQEAPILSQKKADESRYKSSCSSSSCSKSKDKVCFIQSCKNLLVKLGAILWSCLTCAWFSKNKSNADQETAAATIKKSEKEKKPPQTMIDRQIEQAKLTIDAVTKGDEKLVHDLTLEDLTRRYPVIPGETPTREEMNRQFELHIKEAFAEIRTDKANVLKSLRNKLEALEHIKKVVDVALDPKKEPEDVVNLLKKTPTNYVKFLGHLAQAYSRDENGALIPGAFDLSVSLQTFSLPLSDASERALANELALHFAKIFFMKLQDGGVDFLYY